MVVLFLSSSCMKGECERGTYSQQGGCVDKFMPFEREYSIYQSARERQQLHEGVLPPSQRRHLLFSTINDHFHSKNSPSIPPIPAPPFLSLNP